MTTIAADFRSGVMAADSRLNCDDCWVPCTKIVRIGEELFGTAGEVSEEAIFMQWYRGGRVGKLRLRKASTFQVLVLSTTGLWLIDSTGGLSSMDRKFHAIGSGGPAATAAMLAGADVFKAVEIACQIDLYSCPPIQSLRLATDREVA